MCYDYDVMAKDIHSLQLHSHAEYGAGSKGCTCRNNGSCENARKYESSCWVAFICGWCIIYECVSDYVACDLRRSKSEQTEEKPKENIVKNKKHWDRCFRWKKIENYNKYAKVL